jgi:NADPH-dependent ferric siderophore reductase
MSDPQPTAPPGARRGRPAPLRCAVVRSEQRSATMRRIVLGGGDLDRFEWPGPASHLKLMLPLPGRDAPRLPTPGPDGRVIVERSGLTMRTYTPRAWEPERGELAIDVFLHGRSPASAWARGVRPGGQVAISQPRARFELDQQADWLLLAGDESASPALATIVEACADGGGPVPTVVIESSDGDHDLGLPPATDARFVRRHADTPGQAILEALREMVPSGDGQVWIAGEARGIRAVRAYLQGERDIPAAAMITRAYWKRGHADGVDLD